MALVVTGTWEFTVTDALRVSDTMPAPRTGWGVQRFGGDGSVISLQQKEEKEAGDFLVKKEESHDFHFDVAL